MNLDSTSVSTTRPLREVTVVTASDDLAVVEFSGGRGMILATEWFASGRWVVGETFWALQISDDAQPLFSVADPGILEAIFEGLAPEVRDGTVRIMTTARVPGVRAKVAVASTDPSLNPVMACVGRSANRVQAASALLRGERIDVVAWHPDPAIFLKNSFAPAAPNSVVIKGTRASVEVPAHQMSAAVGHSGLNTQLAGQLLGLDVSVTAG